MGFTPQKKQEKPEEKSKSSVAFDFKTAFNQANLLSEQAAQYGNNNKTNFLVDLLENKDQDNVFSALNLAVDGGQDASDASRAFNNQGRFEGCNNQPTNFSNSFTSPQA